MKIDIETKPEADLQELARRADESSFARQLGLKILEVGLGYARAAVRISPDRHGNLFGYIHGAALYALADHAGSVCGNSLDRKAVMIQSTMSFFKNPGLEQDLLAEARVVQEGRRTGHLEVDIRDEIGEILARFQSTIYFFDA
ncbi:MAG: PaaI family thioesterase [Deltaproteobacteria bacterium]|nr:PaaI family thioesterase [Deltaproteobacteria bacterium]